jgi:hypothetical protein
LGHILGFSCFCLYLCHVSDAARSTVLTTPTGSEKSWPWALEVTDSKQGLLYYLQCATLEPRLHRHFHYYFHIYSNFYLSIVSPRCVSCKLSIFCYLLI